MRKGRTDRPISAEMLLGILAGVVLIPLLLAACSLSGPQEPSANADLQDLGISSGTLVPAFAPGATAYTVGVADDVESVTVTAAKASPRARIEVQANGSGWEEIMSGSPCSPLSMDPGMNTVEVRVTAEDTVTSKVYTIEVYRLSAEALLDSLAISAGTLDPAFESQTVSYGSSVANAADTTTVTAVATDYRSTLQVQVNGGGWQSFDSGSPSPVLSLIEGDNLIEIKVTAEDGVTSSLYTITVHRISANAELSALAISAGTLDPVFDASTTSYSATVDSGVGFLKVTTSPADAAAAIHVQANGGVWQLCAPGVASSSLWLDVGDNTVSVRVTAEDGITRKTYTIAVRRLSGNAQLASLMVSPGTLVPAFSSATAVYASTVTGVDGSMTVTAAVADALPSLEARMNAEGWQALSSGSPSPALPLVLGSNTLEVRVTAEDPAVTQVYTVSVARRCPGALDVEFAMLGGGITARALALQADGKVLVGGSSYNGRFWGHFLRLNSDGSLDPSFPNLEQGDWEGASVGSISVQSDGKILIAGGFDAYSGTARGNIARLDSDGSLDGSFLDTEAGANGTISAVAVQPDGKILIGGTFNMVNGVERINLARLNSDGSLDAAFMAGGEAPAGKVLAIAVQSDGKILIGGSFVAYDGVNRGRIARLDSDGSLDTAFLAAGDGAQGEIFPWDPVVYAIGLQPDGRILIGGVFTTVNGVGRRCIARLNGDGSVDAFFPPAGEGAGNAVQAIVVQQDGKILIGGSFSTYNGVDRSCLARLNPDGSLDTSFLETGSGAAGTVYAIAMQGDGRIVIGGGFTSYNGIQPGKVARIWPD